MAVQQGQRVDYEVLAVGDERPEQDVHLGDASAMCGVGAVWGAGPVWDGCYGGVLGLREGSMGVDG